ncbi:MAG TPA: hypothetical protein VHC98_02640 [Candidatus Saccharimonadales bacterium]|nr:hypothetical protein [Candidatus Saccharimonadales bacterium]
MPPQQPTPGYTPAPVPPVESGQYDFIMNYGKNHRSFGSGLPTPGSAVSRALIFGGGVLALIIIAWLFFGVLLAKKPPVDAAAWIGIVQQQSELARISQDPVRQATGEPTQNFAETTRLTLLSDQQLLLTYLQQQGIKKPSNSVLAAKKNTQTDTDLQTAQTNGVYDQTYISVATDQLAAYEQALKQAFTSSKGAHGRQLLSDAYAHAQLLAQQSKQTE